jgi:hypothetical protein
MRYEEPMQYEQYQRGDQYQRDERQPGGRQRDARNQPRPGGPASQSGPVSPSGPVSQYGRPDYDLPQRAEHYASFAEQDAAYTRPRPPGAREQFSPQDDTDPLNIAPLNTGNYS